MVCAVLSAQIKSKPTVQPGAAISGSFSAVGQDSASFASLLQHRFALPEALRQHTVSPDASRKIPVVAGLALPEMNGLELLPPPPVDPPGTWSTVNRMSP